MERLELELAIDHDYVAHVHLHSTMRKDHVKSEIFDLEFTLRFPTTTDKPAKLIGADGEAVSSQSELVSVTLPALAGKVRLRSNISAEPAWQNVPGDLVIKYRPHWFDDRLREYSEWQYSESVYYKDCPYCHRTRYEFRTSGCDASRCLWRQAYPMPQPARPDFPIR
jgi:hypothetical protein